MINFGGMGSGHKPANFDGGAGAAASSAGFSSGAGFETPGMRGCCGLNGSTFVSLSGIAGYPEGNNQIESGAAKMQYDCRQLLLTLSHARASA
jgi:hypothetical protein